MDAGWAFASQNEPLRGIQRSWRYVYAGLFRLKVPSSKPEEKSPSETNHRTTHAWLETNCGPCLEDANVPRLATSVQNAALAGGFNLSNHISQPDSLSPKEREWNCGKQMKAPTKCNFAASASDCKHYLWNISNALASAMSSLVNRSFRKLSRSPKKVPIRFRSNFAIFPSAPLPHLPVDSEAQVRPSQRRTMGVSSMETKFGRSNQWVWHFHTKSSSSAGPFTRHNDPRRHCSSLAMGQNIQYPRILVF